MKKLLIITALALLLPAAGLCWKTTDAMRAVVAAKNRQSGGGGGSPTYFGYATNCTDSCSENTSPITITPPSDMVAGDLVVSYAYYRGAGGGEITGNGGQSWSTPWYDIGWTDSTSTLTIQYCTFDGTWDSSPVYTFSPTTNATTVVMLVFRPASTPHTWAVDTASDHTSVSANTDITISSVNTVNNEAIMLYSWFSDNDVTHSLSGTGWTSAGTAQYRNTGGSDSSVSVAYKIMPTAGAAGDATVTQGESTAGDTITISFY